MKFDHTRTQGTTPKRVEVAYRSLWSRYELHEEGVKELQFFKWVCVILSTDKEEPPRVWNQADFMQFIYKLLCRFHLAKLKRAKLEALKKHVKPLLKWTISPRPVLLLSCPPVSSVAPPSGLVLTAKAFASFTPRGKT